MSRYPELQHIPKSQTRIIQIEYLSSDPSGDDVWLDYIGTGIVEFLSCDAAQDWIDSIPSGYPLTFRVVTLITDRYLYIPPTKDSDDE